MWCGSPGAASSPVNRRRSLSPAQPQFGEISASFVQDLAPLRPVLPTRSSALGWVSWRWHHLGSTQRDGSCWGWMRCVGGRTSTFLGSVLLHGGFSWIKRGGQRVLLGARVKEPLLWVWKHENSCSRSRGDAAVAEQRWSMAPRCGGSHGGGNISSFVQPLPVCNTPHVSCGLCHLENQSPFPPPLFLPPAFFFPLFVKDQLDF